MPDVDVATNFFLVLTFVADAVVAIAVVCAIAALVSPRARASVVSWARAVAPQSVVFAWIVATVTTLGSLYYSEHAGFVPCELCWYQRIVMYPLVIVLGVAALRRDRAVWMTALVFVVIGTPLSLYHWLVERVPAFEESSSCSATTPCSAPWFEKLGFVTLAWMAMSAFLLIGVLMVCTLLGTRGRDDENSTGTVPEMETAPMEEA
jgi:disulfide bond formation protein DsbB